MIIKLNTGVASQCGSWDEGALIDWQDREDAERMIARGFASVPTPAEAKAAQGRIATYTPPARRPDDAWPPGALSALPTRD